MLTYHQRCSVAFAWEQFHRQIGCMFCSMFRPPTMKNIKVFHYWPFVRGTHRSRVDSPHKGPVRVSMSWHHHAINTTRSYNLTSSNVEISTIITWHIFVINQSIDRPLKLRGHGLTTGIEPVIDTTPHTIQHATRCFEAVSYTIMSLRGHCNGYNDWQLSVAEGTSGKDEPKLRNANRARDVLMIRMIGIGTESKWITNHNIHVSNTKKTRLL